MANMELDMVVDIEVDIVADIEVDMVGDMEVDGLKAYWLTSTIRTSILTSTWKSNLVRELVTGVG